MHDDSENGSASESVTFITVLIPLLVGTVLTVFSVAVFLFLRFPADSTEKLDFLPGQLRLEIGDAVDTPDGQIFRLDDTGRGAIALPAQGLELKDYPLLQLQFAKLPEGASVNLVWQSLGTPMTHVALPKTDQSTKYVSMLRKKNWRGEVQTVAILIVGKAGELWSLDRVTMQPTTFAAQFAWIVHEWLVPSRWMQNSINLNTGTQSRQALLYPVPVFVFLLIFCSLAYVIFSRVVFRSTPRLSVIGGLFLLVWVLNDLLWQQRLAWRVVDTFDRYWGLSEAEKLNVSPDVDLVSLSEAIAATLVDASSRVFIVSDDEYVGLRMAYYLYPLNIYYRRKMQYEAISQYVTPGDHLLILGRPQVSFDPKTGELTLPEGRSLSVSPLTVFQDQPMVLDGTARIFEAK